MNIGLDLDGTLTWHKEAVEVVAARNLRIEPPLTRSTDFFFKDFPENLRKEMFRLFDDPKYMKSVDPIQGAQKKLYNWASNNHKVYIITARNEPIRKVTKTLVKKFFPMIDGLFFVNMVDSKTEMMKELKLNIWVDDFFKGIKDAFNLGIKCYMITNEKTIYNHEYRKKLPIHLVPSVARIDLL